MAMRYLSHTKNFGLVLTLMVCILDPVAAGNCRATRDSVLGRVVE